MASDATIDIHALRNEETQLRAELATTHDGIPVLEAEFAALTERLRAARRAAGERQSAITARLQAIEQTKRQFEASSGNYPALEQLRAARDRLDQVRTTIASCKQRLQDVEKGIAQKRAEIADIDQRVATMPGVAESVAVSRRVDLDRSVRAAEFEAKEQRQRIAALADGEAAALREVADAEAVVYAVK